MSKFENILNEILRGNSDNNISFADLKHVLHTLNFEVRIKGDHFIYTKTGVLEIINVQPDGNKAKAYQIKQVRNLIIKYKLTR